MSHKNYHQWLRGFKLRTYKKHYGNRFNIDGVEYKLDSYTRLIENHKAIKVGELIYNIYKNIWEPIKKFIMSGNN
jgi:hypothetical protein